MTDLTEIPMPADQRPLVPVELPRWGGRLYVRTLAVGELEGLEGGDLTFIARLLVRVTTFADGSRVWRDDQTDQVLAYPPLDLKPLIDAALQVNGVGTDALEARKGN